MKRIICALNIPRRIPDRIVYARSIALSLASDPVFVDPNPSLESFTAQIAELQAAEAAALGGGIADTSHRNVCLKVVENSLGTLRSYVQFLVFDLPAGEAVAIIELSGMHVKQVAGPGKAFFVVKPGRVRGSAHLYRRAETSRAIYEWQYSLDGMTWVSAGLTTRADQPLYGLTPATRYFFRVRVRLGGVAHGWSDVFELLLV